jgi:hypothetical protein
VSCAFNHKMCTVNVLYKKHAHYGIFCFLGLVRATLIFGKNHEFCSKNQQK